MVYALIEDLFFRAKIEATAQAAETEVVFFANAADLLESLERHAGECPSVVVDLALGEAAISAIASTKEHPLAPTVCAYGSHVDHAGLKRAREVGADSVMARSTFSERLPEILGKAVP